MLYTGEKRNAYRILMGKCGRMRLRCEDIIKMGTVEWMNVSKDLGM
jgi:hypothetical protein